MTSKIFPHIVFSSFDFCCFNYPPKGKYPTGKIKFFLDLRKIVFLFFILLLLVSASCKTCDCPAYGAGLSMPGNFYTQTSPKPFFQDPVLFAPMFPLSRSFQARQIGPKSLNTIKLSDFYPAENQIFACRQRDGRDKQQDSGLKNPVNGKGNHCLPLLNLY